MKLLQFGSPRSTQKNSHSISNLLGTVATRWLDSDSVVTVNDCQKHSDNSAIGRSVTVLLAVITNTTITVQSPITMPSK